MAASASRAFAPSGPPACAMSGRPPPPLPPSASAPSSHEIDRADALGEIVGDADDQRCLAVRDRDEGDDAGADLRLGIVGKAFQILRARRLRRRAAIVFDAADRLCAVVADSLRARTGQRQRFLRVGQFAFEPAALVGQLRDARGQIRPALVFSAAAASRASSAWSDEIAPRAFAGQRLDAAHAGGDRAFRQDREQADVAEAAHMRAAAQFDRIGLSASIVVAHGQHAHLVAIFLAEQRLGAGLDRLRRSASGASRHRVFWRMTAFTCFSMRSSSSGVTRLGMAKSKRSRSGATSEPFCATCGPSTRFSAACSRCVAEWLARVARRRSPSTRQLDRVADRETRRCVTSTTWTCRLPSFFSVSIDRAFAPSPRTSRPDRRPGRRFAVERRLVGEDAARSRRRRRASTRAPSFTMATMSPSASSVS